MMIQDQKRRFDHDDQGIVPRSRVLHRRPLEEKLFKSTVGAEESNI